MREIKFRGMTPNGGWAYGTITVIHHTHRTHFQEIQCGTYISNDIGLPFAYQVRPETVSEFTGLNDKNGAEIYEGDVLKDDDNRVLLIEWHRCGFCFKAITKTNFVYAHDIMQWFEYGLPRPEIIGNIYENPELLQI